jgi:hypothetical protein
LTSTKHILALWKVGRSRNVKFQCFRMCNINAVKGGKNKRYGTSKCGVGRKEMRPEDLNDMLRSESESVEWKRSLGEWKEIVVIRRQWPPSTAARSVSALNRPAGSVASNSARARWRISPTRSPRARAPG